MDQEFNISPVTLFLVYSGLILIFFRLLRIGLRLVDLQKERRRWIRRYLPLAEMIVWVVLLIWGVGKFMKHEPLYSYGLFVILLAIILISSWYMFRDLIAGIIFKSNNNFLPNETITIGDITGKILRFESRYIVLETLSGKNIHIPYSGLSGSVISKSNPAEKIISSKILLHIPDTHNITDLINRLKEEIINLPWSSVKKYPQIQLRNEADGMYEIEVIVFSIEKDYLYKIEQHLKSKYK